MSSTGLEKTMQSEIREEPKVVAIRFPSSVRVVDGPVFGEQVVFWVDPACESTYLVRFAEKSVFGEEYRVLQKGTNLFTRTVGQTGKTLYQVIDLHEIQIDPVKGEDPIPPKGRG